MLFHFPNVPMTVSVLVFFFAFTVSQQEDGPSSKQASIVPLVIPVSVPVQKSPAESQGVWAHGRLGQGDRPAGPTDRKPSVIVARRRSLKHTLTATFGQVGKLETLKRQVAIKLQSFPLTRATLMFVFSRTSRRSKFCFKGNFLKRTKLRFKHLVKSAACEPLRIR